MDVYSDIEHLIHVYDWSEPSRCKKSRVRDDKERARYLLAEIELTGVDAQCMWRDDVLKV